MIANFKEAKTAASATLIDLWHDKNIKSTTVGY